MFSGLYGDLPEAKDDAKKSNESPAIGSWAGSSALALPPTKRPAASMAPPAVLRAGAGSGGRGRGRVIGQSHTAEIGRGRGASSSEVAAPAPSSVAADPPPPDRGTGAAFSQQSAVTGFWGDIEDEYDPACPNEYEGVLKQRERQRMEAEAEAERQERLREIRELEALEARRESEGDFSDRCFSLEIGHQADHDTEAARREALELSGEEAYLRRAGVPPAAAPVPEQHQPKGMGLAAKMMEKMGWKHGQGLGRNQQGISEPLRVEKTDLRSGRVVVPEGPTAPHQIQAEQRPEPKTLNPEAAWGTPTRVILLRNVVPPGEVDESLDEEVGVECSKHGEVTSVLIFEVTEPNFPEDEAVRIFVQFVTAEAATAALREMDGRFFGGRAVKGRFFEECRFDKADLAPCPGELE